MLLVQGSSLTTVMNSRKLLLSIMQLQPSRSSSTVIFSITAKQKYPPKDVSSRALGIKPYSTETEEAFLQNLNHALDNILLNEGSCSVEREVAISQVFSDNVSCSDLFYTGRFDFVIYQRDYSRRKMPVLAIELDGKEHIEDEIVRERDRKKNKICLDHGFELIRVENSYARR